MKIPSWLRCPKKRAEEHRTKRTRTEADADEMENNIDALIARQSILERRAAEMDEKLEAFVTKDALARMAGVPTMDLDSTNLKVDKGAWRFFAEETETE